MPSSSLRFNLPPQGALTPNNRHDPLRHYYRPLIGRVFRARLDMGLALLEGRFNRLLELGYGSGLLIPTLSSIADELYGVDLECEPPGLRDNLRRTATAVKELVQADVQALPFGDAFFDGVVAFSMLEHLKAEPLRRAGAELARVLAPGGRLLVGCPAVNPVMNWAFALIGAEKIEEHHFSGLSQILAALGPAFHLEAQRALPPLIGQALPVGWAPYTVVLLRRQS